MKSEFSIPFQQLETCAALQYVFQLGSCVEEVQLEEEGKRKYERARLPASISTPQSTQVANLSPFSLETD